MSHIKKLTPEYFKDVKRTMRWTTNKRTAEKRGVSLKTVLQIRNAKNYTEYQEQNKAQHPPVKNSLRDPILVAHKLMFDKKDNKYIEPRAAQTAITQIIFELGK